MNDNNGGNIFSKYLVLKASLALIPIFLVVFVIFMCVIFIFFFMGDGDSDLDSDSGGVATTNGSECGFTISATSLSKKEFKDAIERYSQSYNLASDFVTHADDIYDMAKSMKRNPELVIVRALAESGGTKTTGAYNYYGMGCTNNGGGRDCHSYSSFMDGVKEFLQNISKYSSLMNMMSHYSYLGDYWYNPGSSGKGGCYYAPYIFDKMPSRVKNACASGNTCSDSSCVKTTQDDRDAYTKWQVEKNMASHRNTVFGLKSDEGVSCTQSGSGSTDYAANGDYVQWMINFAADESHGYDQGNRYLPDVDCSSFVYYALLNNGFTKEQLGASAFATDGMGSKLQAAGFTAHAFNASELKRGDILVSPGHHTEVYVGDGKTIGAHISENGGIYAGQQGDQTGGEVSIANLKNYDYYYRLGS